MLPLSWKGYGHKVFKSTSVIGILSLHFLKKAKPILNARRGHYRPRLSFIRPSGNLIHFNVAWALSSADMAARPSTSFKSRPSSWATRPP